MTKRPTWKKTEAESTVRSIADAVAEAFGIEAPEVINRKDEFAEWGDWEWRFETGTIWTGAGRAEMAVDISARFAHMYFRFDDPKRAAGAGYDDHSGRLNRFSGKWNSLEVPPNELRFWVEELKADFAKVAERNPDPFDVAAYEAKAAASAAQWEFYRRAFAAECAAKVAKGVTI